MSVRDFVKPYLVLLLLLLFCPTAEGARVTGSAELNWAEYRREVDGVSDDKASHFYQQYSILYQNNGLINAGRAGRWNMALGYEWNTLDTTVNGNDTGVDTGKILYQGDLVFAPGGLPFQLHAYSQDLQRSHLSYGGGNTFVARGVQDNIIDPYIVDGLSNGQHITTGVTLLAGIQNGTYLGDYRDMLAAFPRLLFDYRDTYVRDLKGATPQHFHLRDLAFVSLNKKKNWFHYRVTDYTDYETSGNDYSERTFLLGTVDHLERRQWINLTNWLKISTDASLTLSEGKGLPGNGSGASEQYQFNLFSRGKHDHWEFSNFTTMSRAVSEGDIIESIFETPWFASGQFNPLDRWKLMTVGKRWVVNSGNTGVSAGRFKDDSSLFGAFEVESRRMRGKVITPKLEMDLRNSSEFEGSGQALRAGVEVRNDQRRDRQLDWRVSDYVGIWDNPDAGTYYENHFKISADLRLNPKMTIGGRQQLAIGSGVYSPNSSEYLLPILSQSFYEQNVTDSRIDTSGAYRSISEAYVELTGTDKWSNRFSGYLDMVHAQGDRHQVRFGHELAFADSTVRLRLSTYLEEGDDLSYRFGPDEVRKPESLTGDPDLLLSHVMTVRYAPSRAWESDAQLRLVWGDGTLGQGWVADFEQNASYNFYNRVGLQRKVLTLREGFDYEQAWGNGTDWYTSLRLSADYYPMSYYVFGFDVEGRHYGVTGQNEYKYGLSAGVAFPKFEARVSYAYGLRDEGDMSVPQVKEQRWEVGVKKIF